MDVAGVVDVDNIVPSPPSPSQSLRHWRIQRLTLVVDVHPLLSPDLRPSYLSSVLSASRILLSFPPLSSSLFAFKLYSSSSPFSSSSLSFHSPSSTLSSLSSALLHLPPSPNPTPHASLTARSLLQLLHEYAWDWDSDWAPPGQIPSPLPHLPSNLVLLFSPRPHSLTSLSRFVAASNDVLDLDLFLRLFSRAFGAVRDGFSARDMRLCWIHVDFDRVGGEDEGGGGDDRALRLLESGVRDLGWGSCSTDAIVLGSALVPFGLIFPKIGCAAAGGWPGGRAQLSLVISDVNGLPLECKCCDLELLHLKPRRERRPPDLTQVFEQSGFSVKGCHHHQRQEKEEEEEASFCLWRNRGHHSIAKICVKELWRDDANCLGIQDSLCDLVLLRGFASNCGEQPPKRRDDPHPDSTMYLPDRVLELLQMDGTEFEAGKPGWPILLSFLHRENYCALVAVSTEGNDNSLMGILRPFTIHSAILCVTNVKFQPDLVASHPVGVVEKEENPADPELKVESNCSDLFPLDHTLGSANTSMSRAVPSKKKTSKKSPNWPQELTWTSFRNAVFSPQYFEGLADAIGPQLDLEALYFSKQCNSSKKLRFLKCWMKQVKRSGGSLRVPCEMKAWPGIEEELQITISSQQELEEPQRLVEEDMHTTVSSTVFPRGAASIEFINGENTRVQCLETLEELSESISQKIEQGINSEEVGLDLLAQRVLTSSINWFSIKFEANASENQSSEKGNVPPYALVASELEKLLLRKPRDLATKYKGCVPSSLKSASASSVYSSEQKVRDHELQILFRIEMLRSKIGANVGERTKQRMVKDICSLLHNIEFNLQGGLFGGESLIEFAERTIKNRYASSIGDVIHKIYTLMEFLSFDDDDIQASGSLPNSEHNSEHRATKENKVIKVWEETIRNSDDINSISADDGESIPLTEKCAQNVGDLVHERKLMEARERRERARRFSSFTSWTPDLQRVWAPKQKVVRAKSESQYKKLGRKSHGGRRKEVVCETPMTKLKRTFEESDAVQMKRIHQGSNSHKSVSKALFIEDEYVSVSKSD